MPICKCYILKALLRQGIFMNVKPNLDDNINYLSETFTDCGDIVSRKLPIACGKTYIYVTYVDMLIDTKVVELNILNPLMLKLRDISPNIEILRGNVFDSLKDTGITTADLSESADFDEIILSMLSGDTAVFVDGFSKAIIVSSKGFPNRGIQTAETESTVYGSKEAFNEVFRQNTALIRRRIRDPKLKIKQLKVGERSGTDIAAVYLDDVVRPAVLNEILSRISKINIDAVLDSGYIEQLIEDDWRSVFPQIQATERPDKAASAILEGRIVLIVDNSPFALIAPATLGTFFQSSEDYYERWHIMSFVRLLRYAAALIAVALPGLYIAATVYHPSMISMPLTLKMAEARKDVPIPAALEVVIMDLAFELIREAGIRLPGPVGSTIGIVGGIIVGQAAVEAGLVSPIVVIVVALTGIAGFAVPQNTFTSGIRLTKYLLLILSSVLGLFGFWAATLFILIHLSSLTSFGVPYMFPFSAADLNNFTEIKDSIFRAPLFFMRQRPFFANPKQSVRMKKIK